MINYKFDLSKKNMNYIDSNLELYNYSKCEYLNPKIYDEEPKKFGFYAYDKGIIIGGAYGWIEDARWCFLDLLFVDEKYRGNDIGTNLIKMVEKFANDNKCIGIRTDTWDFQAKEFYEKQ